MSDKYLNNITNRSTYKSPRRIQPLKSPLIPNLNSPEINRTKILTSPTLMLDRTRIPVSQQRRVQEAGTPTVSKALGGGDGVASKRLSYSDSKITKPLSYSASRITKPMGRSSPSNLLKPTISSINRSSGTCTPMRNKRSMVTSISGSPGVKSNEAEHSSLNFNRAIKKETAVHKGESLYSSLPVTPSLIELLQENKKLMSQILQNQKKIEVLMGGSGSGATKAI